jgi:hypothetical protein
MTMKGTDDPPRERRGRGLQSRGRPVRAVSLRLAASILLTGMLSPAFAQNQPIKGPEDAKCRDEARNHVFTAPNPKGLSLYGLGAELYHACMRRLGAEPAKTPRR